MRKLILIPEYRPLYAMGKCYGPTHGPLTKPCPTPVDVIGQLLLQKGHEAVTIYETKLDDKGKAMEPVQLTLDNYRLSYEEIAGMVEETPDAVIESVEPPAPVVPEIVVPEEVELEPIPEEVAPEVEEEVVETIDDATVQAEEVIETVVETVTTTAAEDENIYAGMTKAERRRARKEAAARQAEAEVAEQ